MQTTIRHEQGCARNPGDCIVDKVETSCRQNEAVVRRHRGSVIPHYLFSQNVEGKASVSGRYLEFNSPYVVPIQFQYGTRIPETGGQWPDEYHMASNRLYAMYDFFETQIEFGDFVLDPYVESVRLTEVKNSLTFAKYLPLCDLGYTFNDQTLYCGNYHH